MYLPAGVCWANAKKPYFLLWLIVKNYYAAPFYKSRQSWLQGGLVFV